jgi:hypothetical protein
MDRNIRVIGTPLNLGQRETLFDKEAEFVFLKSGHHVLKITKTVDGFEIDGDEMHDLVLRTTNQNGKLLNELIQIPRSNQ